MGDLFQHLVDEPIGNVIVMAGLALLFVAAVGKIAGKIEPDTRGRIVSGCLGLILVPGGLALHRFQDLNGDTAKAQPTGNEASIPPRARKNPSAGRRDHCKPGYVWRLAVPSDHVCVTLEVQNRIAIENKLAPSRIRNGGAFGADTCVHGFVWREAVPSDHVCVTAETRKLTAEDNGLASTRIAR
jgi:hypothetical protein